MFPNIKAITFDLWSTLAYNKSKKTFKNYTNFIKSKLGESYYKKMFREPITLEQQIKDMHELSSYKDSVILKSLIKKQLPNIKIYSDVLPTLQYLKQKNYKIGLITNTSYITKPQIESLKLQKYFDVIVYSFEVNTVKPEKKIFEIASDSLKTKNILHIGDDYEKDYLGAKNAGFEALVIDRKGKNTEKTINKLTNLKKYL